MDRNPLYSFHGGSDGSSPEAGPIFDKSGNLYGATELGGGNCYIGCGAVYELSPNGSGGWTEISLYSFQGGSDGAYPEAEVIFDQAGNLYGTTMEGGGTACFARPGCGTTFELSPNSGGTWAEIVLYSFQGGSDGENPQAGLVFDQTGNLYGTTVQGGGAGCEGNGCGVVFEVSREPFVAFSPANLSFGNQTVGISSSPQVATLTNSGNLPLTITSIQITGANSGDFGQTNNCPSSLPPYSSCGINVTFTPAATGNRSAAVSVADNAPGSPQTAPLTGSGVTGVSFSPPTVTFPNQYVGTSGLPQTVMLKNTGDTVLTITNVKASPSDFAPLSSCGNSVVPGATCSLGVFFDPTTSGTRDGVLSVTDSASTSPQTVPLSGMGQDFSLAPSSSFTAAVVPGQSAKYTVAVAPGGGFNQTVTLNCSGAPAQSSCSISPSSVRLNGTTSAPVTVTVTTAGTSATLAQPSGLLPSGTRLALWLALSGLPGLVLLGGRPRKRHGRMFYGLVFLCVLFMIMTWSACGGSSMGNSGGATPAGTYNLTVVGTFTSGSANLVHSTKLTLTVQ